MCAKKCSPLPFTVTYLLELADRIKAGEMSERELLDEEAEEETDAEAEEPQEKEPDGVILKQLEKLRRSVEERAAEEAVRQRASHPRRQRDAERRAERSSASASRKALDELQLGRRHISVDRRETEDGRRASSSSSTI